MLKSNFNSAFFFTVIFTVVSSCVQGQSTASKVLKLNQKGQLSLVNYANSGDANSVNVIPDFSHAGYKGGGVSIPTVSTKIILEPEKGDQTKRLQDAIIQISNLPLDENGFRGKILLKKGEYEIKGKLTIAASGVVLAGEGQGKDGTVLVATGKNKQILIGIGTDASIVEQIDQTRQRITDDFVPTGSVSFAVERISDFAVGDTIFIRKEPNDAWIKAIGMSKYGWKPESYRIDHERIVTAIKGNQLEVNIPLVDPIYKSYGGASVAKARINRVTKQSGVEYVRMVSRYTSPNDENHGWEAVKIANSEHCWVRGVTAQYFGQSCVTILKNAVFNTVEDCAMLDPVSQNSGGRRYSFNIVSGSFNLIQRCYTRSGRHDFVTGGRVTGPNVFLDCYSTNASVDTGPHQRWATGILFDNVYSNTIKVINAKQNGTGHGWTGAQVMLWNCVSQKPNGVVAEVPPTAMNWNITTRHSIGSSGIGKVLDAIFGGIDTKSGPRSLYLKQLEDRLGVEAVENITIPEQRKSNLFNYLSRWQGES
ncbi:hypothetical protein SAMN05660226_02797 [Parapedobacter luteus]|uniref:Pectate lyase n=1 Tax=Parapedobacter luteus TaxID=623280 RepID=A0A1T5DG93_9SPHI|nr:hypothetical protein [Parapedobacter luteus]SKB70724.1 hypothetical protein SAMN05660226_02797 [Parapedobacter luteus]